MQTPNKTKIKQYLLIVCLMLSVFLVVTLFSRYLKSEKIEENTFKQTKKMSLPTASNADLQSLWVQKLETKNKQQAEQLKEAVDKMNKQNQEITQMKQELTQVIEGLSQKIEAQKVSVEPQVQKSDPFQSEGVKYQNNTSAFPSNSAYTQQAQPNRPPIISHSFKALETKKIRHKKENYIPAGSFVNAVILGGIDAAAGVTAQSEPRPVLLRLVDLGVIPNKVRKDIRDCHVIAAGYGDISSERAYVRTERLSCTLVNGDVFEEKIEAYIAGEDGKDGLRGTVVRREGDLIFNSFLAGTIAGVGKGMSQSFGTTSVSPLGSTKTLNGQDVLKSGLYGGAGEGGDQLQKYFIQRAEQMHPIIQISAGREVTIVFLKGVELDVNKAH
jgi:conjugal transfer pilus assembly protein TraB